MPATGRMVIIPRAAFELEEKEGITRLTFTQSGVPEDQYEIIHRDGAIIIGNQ